MNNRTKEPAAVAQLNEKMQEEYASIMLFLKKVRKLNENNYLYQTRYRILRVMKFMESQDVKSISEAKYKHYIDYIQSLGTLSMGSHKVHIDTVRKINEWAYHNGHSNHDILIRLDLIKTPRSYHRPEPKPFSDKEILQVFENIDEKFLYDPMVIDKLNRGMNTRDISARKSLMNVQLKALSWLMLETGLRVSEAYALTVDDVDPINETIGVIGKYGKYREVPYSDLLRERLRTWIAHRKLIAPDEPGLWLALWGEDANIQKHNWFAKPVAYQTFYRWGSYMVGEVSNTNTGAVLESKGRWHRFRKTFATRSNELGMDIGVASKILGHSDTKVTMRYIGIDKQRVISEAKLVESDRANMYTEAIFGKLDAA